MCDCYSHKCEFCDVRVSLHIADFCTPRDTVHVICPVCVKAAIDRKGFGICEGKVFVSRVDDAEQVGLPNDEDGAEGIGVPGDIALIFCDDAKAYGIHLN